MQIDSTSPKPFIFVLMPFAPNFDDLYKFGIKGAAQDIGAYAERVDEQLFTEGILDRIFNQIDKADVIVADMTGRSANVFYEVGYAHALNKIVILLTQDADDIPFDLKHRQHIIYSGSIDILRRELAERLKWAISESKVRKQSPPFETDLSVFMHVEVEGYRVAPAPIGVSGPRIRKISYDSGEEYLTLNIQVNNRMPHESPPVERAFLYCEPDCFLRPFGREFDRPSIKTFESEIISSEIAKDGLLEEYSLTWEIPSLPSKSWHSLKLMFSKNPDIDFDDDIPFRIVLQFPEFNLSYPFVLHFKQDKPIARRKEIF